MIMEPIRSNAGHVAAVNDVLRDGAEGSPLLRGFGEALKPSAPW